jgi:hypothetical protein
VEVESRTWPGINKPGGHGRVVKVNDDGTVNVKYVLGGSEKGIDVKYVAAGVHVAAPRERTTKPMERKVSKSPRRTSKTAQTPTPTAKQTPTTDDTDDLVRWRLGALPISKWGGVNKDTAVSEFCIFLAFVGNPFFHYPYKALMCLFYGSPYPRAYRHFRDAHSKNLNILVHLLCLCYAVVANAMLLRGIDKGINQYWPNSAEVASVSTLLLTAALLLFFTPSAPAVVKVTAVSILVGGFLARDVALHHWKWLLPFDALMQGVNLKLGDAKAVPTFPHASITFLCGLVLSLQWLLNTYLSGALVTYLLPTNLTMAVAMVIGAVRPFYHHANAYWMGYSGWIFAILTDQPWLFCLGAGYGASLMQGVAHDHCREAANLPELAKRSGNERAGDEIGHVTYFPCLILHSAYQSWCR